MNVEAYHAILRRLGVEPAEEPAPAVPAAEPLADGVADEVEGRAVATAAPPLPAPAPRPGAYSYPWPDALPGLGRRTVGPFALCLECRAEWSWVRYGDRVLCLACARRRAG